LGSEIKGRKPAERPHREVIGAAVMESKLFCEALKREEGMAGVEAFLVLPVAAFHLTIVPGRARTDQLVADAEAGGSAIKKGRQVLPPVGKAVGEFKTVVRPDTFHPDTPSAVPLYQPFEETGGGVSRLFRAGGQEAQAGRFVNGGILESRNSGSTI